MLEWRRNIKIKEIARTVNADVNGETNRAEWYLHIQRLLVLQQ